MALVNEVGEALQAIGQALAQEQEIEEKDSSPPPEQSWLQVGQNVFFNYCPVEITGADSSQNKYDVLSEHGDMYQYNPRHMLMTKMELKSAIMESGYRMRDRQSPRKTF